MIWFISDEHYGHRNIIRYTGRPFNLVQEMDRAILGHCLKQFQQDDLVWHLGDFAFPAGRYRKPDGCSVAFWARTQMARLIARMPGTHCIVRGSHDRGAEALRSCGFAVAVEEAVVNLDGRRILLRHTPLYDPLPAGVHGVFHGHIHQGFREDLVAAGERPDVPKWNVNLCVEQMAYGPISYKAALGRLAAQMKGT